MNKIFLVATMIAFTQLWFGVSELQASEDWPKSCDEAVAILKEAAEGDTLEIIKKTPFEDLIMYHHGYGTAIRNEFGLWHGNKVLIKDCVQTYPEVEEPYHPDSISMLIIEHLWYNLNSDP